MVEEEMIAEKYNYFFPENKCATLCKLQNWIKI